MAEATVPNLDRRREFSVGRWAFGLGMVEVLDDLGDGSTHQRVGGHVALTPREISAMQDAIADPSVAIPEAHQPYFQATAEFLEMAAGHLGRAVVRASA